MRDAVTALQILLHDVAPVDEEGFSENRLERLHLERLRERDGRGGRVDPQTHRFS